ncbi:M48 family metalloprotease [Myxococcota bacterium]|nr:M48 family metalloprotease [Myxococcota bacterium]
MNDPRPSRGRAPIPSQFARASLFDALAAMLVASLAGVLLVGASGCASSSGKAKQAEESERARPRRTVLLTSADDVRVGSEAAQEVEAEIGLLADPALAAYVDGIGKKLLRALPRREFAYRFSIVDEMEPNAFALPGGHIYVSRGLLALINDEDELACVLGHEIVHVAMRHAAQQQAVARQQNPLSLPIARQATLASYGRDMEREADAYGQKLCAAAGYDPVAMSTFLRSLDQRDRLLIGHPRTATFLDTHPGSRERAAANSMRASELRFSRDESLGDTRKRFLDRVDGLVIGDRPETGVFLDGLFVHPELDFQIGFPRGWQLQNGTRAVGAIAPRHEAAVFLMGDLPSGDLVEVAEGFAARAEKEHGVRVTQRQRVKLGEIAAVRYSLEGGRGPYAVAAEITFFPFATATWRLVGIAPAAAADRYFGVMLPSMRSFGPLSVENRARVELRRLRVELARPGEDVAGLGARAQCMLPPSGTALLNGLLGNEVFIGGELLKIVRLESMSPP